MDVDCGSARDRLGRTLGGKYHLKEVLGAGGTAVVYRASTPDGQMVAVKVLHDHLSRSEEVCRRFVREGQLGNVLDHPGTVRVLDHGSTEEKCPYLVLEFLEGESLEERRVRNGGRLEMWETLDFCDQLLAVLEIAHAKSIVHRDIKPSNLFITTTGVLKVLDFGIARFTEDTSSATSTKTGTMVGTPAFMPPEQALSRPRDVDARTDIWSVGATLFTLLSGEHVHIAETSSEHLVKAATLHARSLARALPGVPANVEALVARCLSFDKNERWATATSMRTELTYVRDDPGRRIGTSTSPPPERYPSNPNMPTLIGSMRHHEEAGTISAISASGSDKPPSSGRGGSGGSDDRTIDATMSLNSHPGTYDGQSRLRRKWLLPFAIASTVLLILMSGVVLVLAVRTTTPSQAAVAAAAPPPQAPNTPIIELPNDPPPAAATYVASNDSPPLPAPPPPPTPPTPAKPVSTSVNTSSTTVVTLTPRGAPQPASSAKKSVGRPSGPVNKDVYRPF
jgi:serine/threonine protein kinase